MDFGFYIDAKGRTVVECECHSYVVFAIESEAISRLCFRCGKNVERPLEFRRVQMLPYEFGRKDLEPDKLPTDPEYVDDDEKDLPNELGTEEPEPEPLTKQEIEDELNEESEDEESNFKRI